MKKTLAILALCAAIPLFGQGRRYEVEITNLTYGQVFTPILVASHEWDVKLFQAGGGASVELEMLAEGGSTAALMALLDANPQVGDVTDSGGVLTPGQTTKVVVTAQWPYNHISLAAMLVPTNDAFIALNGVAGPKRPRGFGFNPGAGGPVTVYLPVWDAGTEANDEDCAKIPAGGVCEGEGFNPDRMGAEGFIQIHRGIFGGADLDPKMRDWKNPAARVVIRRVR